MKIKHLLLSAIAVATALVSCQKDLSKEQASLVLSDSAIAFESSAAGTKTITLTSNRMWEVQIPADAAKWVSVSPDSGEASADPQTIEITVAANPDNDRTAEISFRIVGGTKKLTVSQKGDKGEAQPGDGTAAHPYSVAEARAFIDGLAGSTSKSVYVKGYLHKIGTLPSGKTTINLFITDDMSNTKDDLELFATADFNGGPFNSQDDVNARVKQGDLVVAYGALKLYNTTYEMTYGELVSVNGTGVTVESKEVTGVVVAKHTSGFLIQSGETITYIFDKNIVSQVEVGDDVTVSGTVKNQNGTPELVDCTLKSVNSQGNTVTYPEPVVLDGSALDAYETIFGYVKTTGILRQSGQYYNVEISGATKEGSISFASGIDANLVNKNVDITGYYVGLSSSSSATYFNILYTKIELSSEQPEQPKLPDFSGKSFVKTTTVSEGYYLLAYDKSETETLVFNCQDAQANYSTVTVSEGTIAYSEGLLSSVVEIAAVDGGYSLTALSINKFMGGKSDKNTIQFVASPIANTIDWQEANSAFKVSSNSASLVYNNATSNGDRFRFYKQTTIDKDATSKAQYNYIQLYKVVE